MTVSPIRSVGSRGGRGQVEDSGEAPSSQRAQRVCLTQPILHRLMLELISEHWSLVLTKELYGYVRERFEGRLIREIEEPKLGIPRSVHTLSDDSVVIGYEKGPIVVRDSHDPQVKIAVLEGDGNNLSLLTLGSHDTIVAVYTHAVLKVFNFKKSTHPVCFRMGHNLSAPGSMVVLDNGKIVTLNSSRVLVWDPQGNSREAVVLGGDMGLLPRIIVRLKGNQVAVVYDNRSIGVWDTDQPATQTPLLWQNDQTILHAPPYPLSNGLLAVQGVDDAIRAWDPDKSSTQTPVYLTGRHTPKLKNPAFRYRSFIEVGQQIVALCKDDLIRVWDPKQLETQKPCVFKSSQGIRPYNLMAAPGERVVCACTDGQVYVWDIHDLEREPVRLSGVAGRHSTNYFYPSIGLCSDGGIVAATRQGSVGFWY